MIFSLARPTLITTCISYHIKRIDCFCLSGETYFRSQSKKGTPNYTWKILTNYNEQSIIKYHYWLLWLWYKSTWNGCTLNGKCYPGKYTFINFRGHLIRNLPKLISLEMKPNT